MIDFEGLERTDDVSVAAWITSQLTLPWSDGTVRVNACVPDCFEAYARVFHPAYRPPRRIRWAAIAQENGRVVHDQMQFHRLLGLEVPGRVPDLEPPRNGSMVEPECLALSELLRGFETMPEPWWFALWEGYACLEANEPGPLEHPDRRYFLYRGASSGAMAFRAGPLWWQSPNLWWLADRSWCVATEIDYGWTYVGGSAELIAAVCKSPHLEALPTTADARADAGGDHIN